MSTIFVLMMFIPWDRGSSSFVAEFSDEMACYSAANNMLNKFQPSTKEYSKFVCMPKQSKK